MQPTANSNSTVQPADGVAAPLCALAALLTLGVPLFLRMPLTNDAEVYDLQAAVVRDGGILYRELLEPNLPGVVAIHLGVRSLFGESSEALRVFDLCVLSLTLWGAASLVRCSGGSWRAALWTVFALAACYLSLSEWCHCQRDLWMLAPMLAACNLRLRRILSLPAWGGAFVEGLLWGSAVWLKPYVVIPGLGVWMASVWLSPSFRRTMQDAACCLLGGVSVGIAGIGVMFATGCWPHFVETLQNWNPAYFTAGRAHWTWIRWLGSILRMSPWCLFHLGAIAVTLRGAAGIVHSHAPAESLPQRVGLMLLGAGYGGWTLQALMLQHQFDYVFAPTVLLAILVVVVGSVGVVWRWSPVVWYGFAVLALIGSPLTEWQRLQWWVTCVRGPVTAEIRDDLMHFQNPSQQDLARVDEFLAAAGVQEQEVCCYNSDFVSLYRRLGLRPPVRYAYLFETLQFFPQRREQILGEVAQSPHRFVVTDLVSCGLPRRLAEEVGPDGPHAPPPAYATAPHDVYPWTLPVVFRTGTYLIHQVDGPIAPAFTDATRGVSAVHGRH